MAGEQVQSIVEDGGMLDDVMQVGGSDALEKPAPHIVTGAAITIADGRAAPLPNAFPCQENA
jgi:hypothetical protein